MKKFFAVIMAMILITVPMFCIHASAAGSLNLTVESMEAKPGDTITVRILADSNPGFMYMKVRLYYDASALDLVKAVNGEVATEGFEIGAKTGNLKEAFVWSPSADATNTGVLVTMTFKVLDTAAPGSYTIEARPYECYNYDEDEVAVESSMGTITVLGAEESSVTNVAYTPSASEKNDFSVTVNGRADKIRFTLPGGSSCTFGRHSLRVKDIKSYRADGTECSSRSDELAYEIWTVNASLPAGREIKAFAKLDNKWENAGYAFTVTLKNTDSNIYSISYDKSSLGEKAKKITVTVIAGPETSKIRFTYPGGGTSTFDASKYAEMQDGKLVFTVKVNVADGGILGFSVKEGKTWIDKDSITFSSAV